MDGTRQIGYCEKVEIEELESEVDVRHVVMNANGAKHRRL